MLPGPLHLILYNLGVVGVESDPVVPVTPRSSLINLSAKLILIRCLMYYFGY